MALLSASSREVVLLPQKTVLAALEYVKATKFPLPFASDTFGNLPSNCLAVPTGDTGEQLDVRAIKARRIAKTEGLMPSLPSVLRMGCLRVRRHGGDIFWVKIGEIFLDARPTRRDRCCNSKSNEAHGVPFNLLIKNSNIKRRGCRVPLTVQILLNALISRYFFCKKQVGLGAWVYIPRPVWQDVPKGNDKF